MRSNHKSFLLALLSTILALGGVFITWQVIAYGNSNLFTIGDYYFEVDPIILRFLEKPNINFYDSFFPPLMMPFSLLIRTSAISVLVDLGLVSGATDPIFAAKEFRDRYLAGALIVVFLGFTLFLYQLFSSFPDYWKKARGKGSIFYFLLFAIPSTILLAVNPLVTSSILWGHPEEALMGCLLAGGGLALLRGKTATGAVLLGLAVATKQPAVFILPAAFLFVPSGERRRFVLFFLATASITIVPWAASDARYFWEQNFVTAGGQDFNIDRGFELLTPLGLRDWAEVGKPLIAAISLLLPLSLARLNQEKKSWRPSALRINPLQFAGGVVIVFVFRFALDIGNISYYAAPAGLCFILLDWVWQKKQGGVWRRSIENPPMPLPVLAFAGSAFFGLLLYQRIFSDMGPDWRGSLTLIVLGFPLLAGVLSLYQPVSHKIRFKQWLATGATLLLLGVALGVYHKNASAPPQTRIYKELKRYQENRQMKRALLPGQQGYWLGESPQIKPGGAEILFRGLDGNITFNVHAPEGRRATYFDYGSPGKRRSLEIITYNTAFAERKDLINQCLAGTGSCLGYRPIRNLPAGDAILYRYKKGWEAYIRTPKQTIYLRSRDPEIDPIKSLKLIKAI